METKSSFRQILRRILNKLLNFVENHEVSVTNNLSNLIDLTIEDNELKEFYFIRRLNNIKQKLVSLIFKLNIREIWKIPSKKEKRSLKKLIKYQRSLKNDLNRKILEARLNKIIVLLKRLMKNINGTEIINLNDNRTESEGDSDDDADNANSDSRPNNEESKNPENDNQEIILDSEDSDIDSSRINEPEIIALDDEEEKDLEELKLEEIKDYHDSSFEFDIKGLYQIKKGFLNSKRKRIIKLNDEQILFQFKKVFRNLKELNFRFIKRLRHTICQKFFFKYFPENHKSSKQYYISIPRKYALIKANVHNEIHSPLLMRELCDNYFDLYLSFRYKKNVYVGGILKKDHDKILINDMTRNIFYNLGVDDVDINFYSFFEDVIEKMNKIQSELPQGLGLEYNFSDSQLKSYSESTKKIKKFRKLYEKLKRRRYEIKF